MHGTNMKNVIKLFLTSVNLSLKYPSSFLFYTKIPVSVLPIYIKEGVANFETRTQTPAMNSSPSVMLCNQLS